MTEVRRCEAAPGYPPCYRPRHPAPGRTGQSKAYFECTWTIMVTAGRLWMSTVVVGALRVKRPQEAFERHPKGWSNVAYLKSIFTKKNEERWARWAHFCAFSARRPLQCSSHKSRPLTVVYLLTHVQNTDRHSAYVAKSGIKHRPSELESGNERHRPSKQTADCEQSWR